MLGISVADAVLVGTLLLSIVAMWRGSNKGASDAKSNPPSPDVALIGSALVDTIEFKRLNENLEKIAELMRESIDQRERGLDEKLNRLLDQVEVERAQSKRPRPSRE